MRRTPPAGVALLLCVAFAAPAGAQEPPRLVVDQGGIVVIDDAGTQRHVIAPNGSRFSFSDPGWAPDGRRIVATRTLRKSAEGEGHPALVLLDTETPGVPVPVALPGGEGLREPAFSPDGTQLVAARARGRPQDVRQELVVLPAAGGTPRRLTTGAYDTDPAWSPDGASIAFTRETDPTPGGAALSVLLVPAGGGAPRTLVRRGYEPAWSPDGTRIAFASARDANGRTCFHDCRPNAELYVAAADGSAQRRLTRTEADEAAPAWSPDGTRLAFSSDRHYPASRSHEVFAADPDGGCVTQLTFAAAGAANPSWQPGVPPPAHGPCGSRVVPYLDDVDASGVPVRHTRALFPGRAFDGMLLTGADRGFLVYDDCDRADPRRCPGEIQVQIGTVCARHPAQFDVPVQRLQRVRGALVVHYDGVTDIHTGGTTLSLYGRATADVRALVAALRPLAGPPRLDEPLAAPRFGPRLLGRLRGARRVRRGGFGVSRTALVRSDARVLHALRSFGSVSGRRPACAR